jgi:hypothetical protein
MDKRQKEIIGMMERAFGIDALRHMEAGDSLTALYNMAAHMHTKVEIINPDRKGQSAADTHYRIKIDRMDVHDGHGGITGFCGWGLTQQGAAENYITSCADAIESSLGIYRGLLDKYKPEDFKGTMGFCLDTSKDKRFDFITTMGEGLPPLGEASTVLQNPVKPLPTIKLRK